MIPKSIHMMWIPDYEQAPTQAKANPDKWRELNPEYSLRIWSEVALRELIGDQYGDYLAIWESLPRPVMRADLARLFVIHAFGGVYLDMDLIPISPLAQFFESDTIYNRHLKLTKQLPQMPSEDYIDKSKVRTILSREHCAIDNVGVGVANGVIISEPGVDWIMDFVEVQKFAFKGLVLDYVGTWALTRYIRSRVESLQAQGLVMMPPHYFLWEERHFNCRPPFYAVCIHPEGNSWGDHSKPNWWMV